MRALRAICGWLAAAFLAVAPATAQTLTVWHDLGDNGIAWFEQIGRAHV